MPIKALNDRKKLSSDFRLARSRSIWPGHTSHILSL
ncbi:hypothetical protein F8B43_5034 [Methylorubrum populi]|uniref:Uncharacterized protein n=1 Tax=Methylorubrum populi TaxID=223967 RepID=A0A833N1T2_9HYPH|nr:hypothetical protein F8B43_5034 [Methylorubrum populi]